MHGDLREGIYSFPVLWLARQETPLSAELRSLLKRRPLADADAVRALQLAREGGGAEAVLQLAREYAARARAALEGMAEHAARRSLSDLAEYAVARVAPCNPVYSAD